MDGKIELRDIRFHQELLPGDLEQIVYLHGKLYHQEYQYTKAFEHYVEDGLREFQSRYDPLKDRVWVCRHQDQIVGFLLGMHRGPGEVQLRFFLVLPAYRGIGLGKFLLKEFMNYMREAGYKKAYLLTTHEQEKAASLYSRFGFQLTEEKNSTVFGKPLREQRYDWNPEQ